MSLSSHQSARMKSETYLTPPEIVRALELAGENARLRNALQLIADWRGGCGVDWPQEMARKALDANPAVLGTTHKAEGDSNGK